MIFTIAKKNLKILSRNGKENNMETTFEEAGNTSLALLDKAKSLVVNTPEDYLFAGTFKSELKSQLDMWVEKFEPLRLKTKASYDEVLKQKRIVCEPYSAAIEVVGKAINSYATRLENERRAAQARLEAQARAAAEVERQKLLERAAAAKTESKQEELLERAENVYVEPVIAKREIEKMVKTEDVKMVQRKELEVTLTDMKLLCVEIVAGRVPVTVVDTKLANLKTWVKAMGIKQCPGLSIREKTIVV